MGKIKCPKCNKRSALFHGTFGVVFCKQCQDNAKIYHKGKPLNLTEGSERIRKQREEYHDDFLQPHAYNKSSRKLEINREFVNKYPDKAHLYYSPDEMKQAGLPKLIDYSQNVQASESRQKEKVEAFKRKVIQYKQSRNPTNIREFLKRL